MTLIGKQGGAHPAPFGPDADDNNRDGKRVVESPGQQNEGEPMPDTLRVGAILYGFCGGYFGRDSYDDKRVEVIGADYVVVRNSSGQPEFAHIDPDDLMQFTSPEASE